MKYKLIKEYPGSPKLGYVYNPEQFEEYCNYTEFWEQVVEKDYEILSLVASERNPQHKKGSKFLHNKDYKFKNMYPTEFWDIYSVKRISDNKIFTIGDFYEDLIIEKMFMSVAGDILTTYKPKVKQPLFTTEDGVDIFKNIDKYYTPIYIVDKALNIKYCEKDFSVKPSENVKYFSTKEKAEEYILLNKPCLSLNDLKQFFPDTYIPFKKGESATEDVNTKQLEDLVKSKIQQSV